MRIFPEEFDPFQFDLTTECLFTIKRPYKATATRMPFTFKDYNSNLQLQCVIYFKLLKQCANVFGIFEMNRRVECLVCIYIYIYIIFV